MEISIAQQPEITRFERAKVSTLEGMAELCLKNNFSPAIFKNGYRKLANFEIAYCIGLDVDNDGRTPFMSLADAKSAFAAYTHLILPSRSHQKDKDGRVCDRFRIILFFTRPITDIDEFYATWFWCKEQWPAIDPQCKDPSRFYFQHSGIESIRRKGKRIEPVAPKPKQMPEKVNSISPGQRGDLSHDTLKFLVHGATKGSRNGTTYKAAKEFQQNGYPMDEAKIRIIEALEKSDTFAFDFTEDEVIQTIESAYNTEAKHEARIRQRAFNLMPIGQFYKTKTEMDWLVHRLLTIGGVSLMSSDPKAGKSTLVRQLMREVLRGSKFLGRQCKKGGVHYFAIEEQAEVVNASFSRLGIKGDEDLLVHVGDVLAESKLEDFRELLLEKKPVLAVIDTLFDFLDVESENNYKEVKREFRKLRQIARETRTHILLVHHNSKPQIGDKRRGNRAILGSQAIAGGVDTVMVIEVDGKKRLISTSGREIEQWQNHELIFNSADTTYALGKEVPEVEF